MQSRKMYAWRKKLHIKHILRWTKHIVSVLIVIQGVFGVQVSFFFVTLSKLLHFQQFHETQQYSEALYLMPNTQLFHVWAY